MKTKWLFAISLIIAACLTSCQTTNVASSKINYARLSPFAVSYEKITPRQAAGYDLLIVEPQQYNKAEVAALKATGADVLGYLSVGEVSKDRWYFSKMEERGFLGKNENWDAYYINLADPVTYHLFFDEIIPDIMIRDFDGLFLDTVDDVAPHTPRTDLRPRMVKLINQIASEYPDAMIVQNGGLFLLDQTASSADAVLLEDVATAYNFERKSYTLKPENAFNGKVQTVKAFSKEYAMPFLLVDFAISDSLRSAAKSRLDKLSYPYFINNIALNNISGGVSGNNY